MVFVLSAEQRPGIRPCPTVSVKHSSIAFIIGNRHLQPIISLPVGCVTHSHPYLLEGRDRRRSVGMAW